MKRHRNATMHNRTMIIDLVLFESMTVVVGRLLKIYSVVFGCCAGSRRHVLCFSAVPTTRHSEAASNQLLPRSVYFPIMHQLLLLLLLLLVLEKAADNRRCCRTLLGSNRLMLYDASSNALIVEYIQKNGSALINRPAMFELLSCLLEGRALSPPDRSSVFSLRSSLVFRVAVSSFR
jgi:hypothetical protein